MTCVVPASGEPHISDTDDASHATGDVEMAERGGVCGLSPMISTDAGEDFVPFPFHTGASMFGMRRTNPNRHEGEQRS